MALNAYGLTVGQGMDCTVYQGMDYAFSAHGEVNLARAHIGGSLDCDGAVFRNAWQGGCRSKQYRNPRQRPDAANHFGRRR